MGNIISQNQEMLNLKDCLAINIYTPTEIYSYSMFLLVVEIY